MAMTTTPQLKEIKPISFLFFRTETSLGQLQDFVPVGQDLFKEAVNYKLQVTGPIHWHYLGFHGDPTEPFTLEISLPVAETLAEYDGSFHFKRTDKFRCATMTHEGSWSSIADAYSALHQFITSKGLRPLAINREVYLNADFKDPDANLTEIQVGVE
jgi:effector-binding domain-containing protein